MGQVKVLDRHIMVDLETLANESAYPLITSVALVEFDMASGDILDTFRINIDIASSIQEGFDIAGHNLEWWTETPEKVKVFRDLLVDTVTIREALYQIQMWFHSKKVSEIGGVWGNSNRFDLGILGRAFNKLFPKRGYPWEFFIERDVRTLMDLYPMINRIDGTSLPDYKTIHRNLFKGDFHDPLADCKNQIEYVVAFMNDLRRRIKNENF